MGWEQVWWGCSQRKHSTPFSELKSQTLECSGGLFYQENCSPIVPIEFISPAMAVSKLLKHCKTSSTHPAAPQLLVPIVSLGRSTKTLKLNLKQKQRIKKKRITALQSEWRGWLRLKGRKSRRSTSLQTIIKPLQNIGKSKEEDLCWIGSSLDTRWNRPKPEWSYLPQKCRSPLTGARKVWLSNLWGHHMITVLSML